MLILFKDFIPKKIITGLEIANNEYFDNLILDLTFSNLVYKLQEIYSRSIINFKK